jgi:hypothetical protein
MEEVISEKAARVLDLLEQIEAVNEMISLHEDDSFMKDQYVYRKEEFIKELVIQLGEYNIEKEDLAA